MNVRLVLGALALGSIVALAEPTPYPSGRITLKTAVVVYNPIVTNTIKGAHGSVLSEEMGWGNPTNTVVNQQNWWRQCSRGMVNFEIVYWTNLFQVMRNMEEKPWRPSVAEVYEAAVTRKEFKMGHMDEMYSLTNDVPQVWEGIKKGEIDQVWYVIYPFGPGGWESIMQGTGASWCNSCGRYAPIPQCFMTVFPTSERQDTPMENFGHAFESIMAMNYSNGGDWDWRPEDNEWTLYTRQWANIGKDACHIGYVHYAPNTPRDYLWGEDRIVWSYAPGWLRYPDMLKIPPVPMNTRYWGGGVNANHKQWMYYHAPQRCGLYRGHLMNWLTMYFDLNKAAYPMEPGSTLHQQVDPRGWFNFSVKAPAGTTAVVFRVASPAEKIHSGVRKNLLPKRFRPAQEETGKAFDEFTEKDGRCHEKTFTITKDKDYAKDMEGEWYFTCGGGEPHEGLCDLYVTALVLPKPAPEELSLTVETLADINGDEGKIVWTAKEPKAGWRTVTISFSENGPEGPFTPICQDFAFSLKSPYRWFLPAGQYANACVKVEMEDRYGRTVSATSKSFAINRENPWQIYDVPGTDDAWGDRLIGTKAGTDGTDYYFTKANVKMSPFFRRTENSWQPLANLPCGRYDDMTPLVPCKNGLLTSLGFQEMDASSNRYYETALAFYSVKDNAWTLSQRQRTSEVAALATLDDGTVFLADEDADHPCLLKDFKTMAKQHLEGLPGGRSYQWTATSDGQTAYFAKFNGEQKENAKGVVASVSKEGKVTVLPEPPFNPGLGASLCFVPGKYFEDQAGRLYFLRGGTGIRRLWIEHENGKRFNVDCSKDNLAIFNLKTQTWTLETLPVPTDEGSRLTLVGNRLYLLGASNIHMPLRIMELKEK